MEYALSCWLLVGLLYGVKSETVVGYTEGTAQTRGQPWPMPSSYSPSQSIMTLNQFTFQFQIVGQDCSILRAAVDRYFKMIFYPGLQQTNKMTEQSLRFRPRLGTPELDKLIVSVKDKCYDNDLPSLEMDESCKYAN